MLSTIKQPFAFTHNDYSHPDGHDIYYTGMANITQGQEKDENDQWQDVDEVEIIDLKRNGVDVPYHGEGRDWREFIARLREHARDQRWKDACAKEVKPGESVCLCASNHTNV